MILVLIILMEKQYKMKISESKIIKQILNLKKK